MSRRRSGIHQPPQVSPDVGRLQVYRAHPDAWATARHLADGDFRHLRVLPDGSVIVENNADWRWLGKR